mmetsp:Transcript_120181/g.256475  ORF Transcript_120181/g.256475 Transcript_120181/m.256475 type:complete len:202 (-) Transcript_120181:569-1174(-)
MTAGGFELLKLGVRHPTSQRVGTSHSRPACSASRPPSWRGRRHPRAPCNAPTNGSLSRDALGPPARGVAFGHRCRSAQTSCTCKAQRVALTVTRLQPPSSLCCRRHWGHRRGRSRYRACPEGRRCAAGGTGPTSSPSSARRCDPRRRSCSRTRSACLGDPGVGTSPTHQPMRPSLGPCPRPQASPMAHRSQPRLAPACSAS